MFTTMNKGSDLGGVEQPTAMDPNRFKPWRPCSFPSPHHHHHHHHHCLHHHHHHHHHQLFHHHHHLCHHCHRHGRPNFVYVPPNPEPAPSSAFFRQGLNVADSSGFREPGGDSAVTQVVQQELEQEQYYGIEDEDEDEDEPVFVLTDEWRDFFAKSEAKRKLEKKRTKKGKK
ncbi:hypothetical protein TIFTF001_019420 [Ficus carica]|uniref:Uncharacterized protein n=1 Tax=Ficus carica TaxID=3494 RepID=A0AA88DBR8_FICCA|nr:hypothetical protein TIFTF001_019420 [Ficus carica]